MQAVERDDNAFQEGIVAAQADVAAGRLIYRWTGHSGHWGHWVALQLAERFGVVVEGLGICLVTAASVSFNDGYNSVQVHEIERRHGPDAFQSLLTESRNQSEESLWDAKQLWMERHNASGSS